MTKLTNMRLGKREEGMFFCKKCKHYVPREDKHNKKRHNKK